MNELLALAIKELPGVIQSIKDAHAQAHPDLPPLTDAEVVQSLKDAIASSEVKDDNWLAIHPE